MNPNCNFIQVSTFNGVPAGGGGGTGDVVGPASAVSNNIATYNGITGKLIKDSGVAISDVIVVTDIGTSVQAWGSKLDTFQALADGTTGQVLSTNGAGVYSWVANSGDVVGPASATDSVVAVFDGTTGKLLKNSTVAVADILVSGDIGTSVQGYDTTLASISTAGMVLGSLFIGTAPNTVAQLTIGTSGQVLTSNGTTALWSNSSGGSSAWNTTTYAASQDIDWSTGNKQQITATGNITFNTISNWVNGQTHLLKILASTGDRTVNIPSAWIDALSSTIVIPSGEYIIIQFEYDGTNIFAVTSPFVVA